MSICPLDLPGPAMMAHTIEIPVPRGRRRKPPTHKSLTQYLIELNLPADSHGFLKRFTELVSPSLAESFPSSITTLYEKESYLQLVRRIIPVLVGDDANTCWLALEDADAIEQTRLTLYLLLTCTFQLYMKEKKGKESMAKRAIEGVAGGSGRTRLETAREIEARNDVLAASEASLGQTVKRLEERVSQLEAENARITNAFAQAASSICTLQRQFSEQEAIVLNNSTSISQLQTAIYSYRVQVGDLERKLTFPHFFD